MQTHKSAGKAVPLIASMPPGIEQKDSKTCFPFYGSLLTMLFSQTPQSTENINYTPDGVASFEVAKPERERISIIRH